MDPLRTSTRIQKHKFVANRSSFQYIKQAPIPDKKRNNPASGFATISGLFLIILLMITALGAFQLIQLIHTTKAPLHICRSQLLDVQNQVGKKISQLMTLNSTVHALRAEDKAARAALVAALISVMPPAIAAAKAWNESVLLRKNLIRLRQKSLLLSGRWQLQSALFKTKKSIQEELEQRKNKISGLWYMQRGPITSSLAKMSVVPDYAGTDLPTYRPSANFIQAQALQITWNFELQLKNQELKKWVPSKIIKKDSCVASLEENSDSFQSVLVAVRPFSNLLSWR